MQAGAGDAGGECESPVLPLPALILRGDSASVSSALGVLRRARLRRADAGDDAASDAEPSPSMSSTTSALTRWLSAGSGALTESGEDGTGGLGDELTDVPVDVDDGVAVAADDGEVAATAAATLAAGSIRGRGITERRMPSDEERIGSGGRGSCAGAAAIVAAELGTAETDDGEAAEGEVNEVPPGAREEGRRETPR
jgi:hypothetical protein